MGRRHNLTSQRLIITGELPEDFDALAQDLTAQYQPESALHQSLVHNMARAVWLLERVHREFDKSQQELFTQQPDMRLWSPEQHAEFALLSRYHTTAERQYTRAFHAVEHISGYRLRARRLQLAETLAKNVETRAKSEPKSKPPNPEIYTPKIWDVHQDIAITLTDGQWSISVYPDHATFLGMVQRATPGAKVVRTFEFPNGLPPEYAWLNAALQRDSSDELHPPDEPKPRPAFSQIFATRAAWHAHVARENGCFLPAAGP
jgi:hypothetical protein